MEKVIWNKDIDGALERASKALNLPASSEQAYELATEMLVEDYISTANEVPVHDEAHVYVSYMKHSNDQSTYSGKCWNTISLRVPLLEVLDNLNDIHSVVISDGKVNVSYCDNLDKNLTVTLVKIDSNLTEQVWREISQVKDSIMQDYLEYKTVPIVL